MKFKLFLGISVMVFLTLSVGSCTSLPRPPSTIEVIDVPSVINLYAKASENALEWDSDAVLVEISLSIYPLSSKYKDTIAFVFDDSGDFQAQDFYIAFFMEKDTNDFVFESGTEGIDRSGTKHLGINLSEMIDSPDAYLLLLTFGKRQFGEQFGEFRFPIKLILEEVASKNGESTVQWRGIFAKEDNQTIWNLRSDARTGEMLDPIVY